MNIKTGTFGCPVNFLACSFASAPHGAASQVITPAKPFHQQKLGLPPKVIGFG